MAPLAPSCRCGGAASQTSGTLLNHVKANQRAASSLRTQDNFLVYKGSPGATKACGPLNYNSHHDPRRAKCHPQPRPPPPPPRGAGLGGDVVEGSRSHPVARHRHHHPPPPQPNDPPHRRSACQSRQRYKCSHKSSVSFLPSISSCPQVSLLSVRLVFGRPSPVISRSRRRLSCGCSLNNWVRGAGKK